MRRIALILTAIGFAGAGYAQRPSMTEMMFDAVTRTTRPQAEHKELGPLEGSWAVEAAFTSEDWAKKSGNARRGPSLRPLLMKGTARNSWILGGRYLESRLSLKQGKRSFERILILGYDTKLKAYTSLSVDSMTFDSPGSVSLGTFDTKTRRFTFDERRIDRPKRELPGGRKVLPPVLGRCVISLEQNDQPVWEFFTLGPKGPEKNLTLTCKRN